MLLITLPSMLYAEITYAEAQAQANATEQSEDLFADIGGTPLNDEQADAVSGYGLPIFLIPTIIGILSIIIGKLGHKNRCARDIWAVGCVR